MLKSAAMTLALCVCLLPSTANAQNLQEIIQPKEVQIAAGAFSLADPIPAWVEPIAIPEASQIQSVVLRLADTQYLVDGVPIAYVRRALMINDVASLSSAGQIAIPFVPQYHKLKLHVVRVLRKGESLDRTASSTVRFLQRETGLEQGVYSGEVTASVLVSDLRVGDTLEFAYSLHGDNPVFGGRFAETASWDQASPTTLRRIVLNHPVGRQISWRVIGDRRAKPVVPTAAIRDGMRQLVFEERSISKFEMEPSTPPDYPAYRRVQFSEFSGWDDIVAWAGQLFQRQGELSQEVRDVIEKLRQMPTDENRVVGALEFVQSEIRYFSVSLGESSHRPTQPDVVVQRRYGDCKDKSLLLMTLLEALGIQSKPVLLAIGMRKGLDKMLPSPEVFNHAIVQVTVNGKVFYLDPTLLGQHGRLDRMGQLHEGAQALVVAPQNRQLSTIASTNARDLVRSEVSETVTLPKLNADGQLQVRQIWRGTMAEGLRLLQERLPRDELVRSVGGHAVEARYPGAMLLGEPDIQDDRTNNVFSMTAQYLVPKLATERGGDWFVRFSPRNMIGVLATPPSPTRTTPLQLPMLPYDARYTFEIKFPDEVSVISDPRANTVGNKYFNYTVTSSFRGSSSKTVIELATFADQVETSDLKKYTEDMRSLANVVVGVVVVPKTAIKKRWEGVGRWYEWVAVALLALYFLAIHWRRVRTATPVPLDPSKPYQAFCHDFDLEVEAEKIDAVLGPARNSISEERFAEIEKSVAAWRVHHELAALETAARIRSANSQDVLEDTVVSLLIDHSGSMRGQPILLAARAAMMASDLLEGLRTKHEVLGFTTVRWKGGLSREKWLRSGRSPYPGRLNDVLHIIYCSAGQRLHARHCATMLREELLKENLDGEAIEWAASRLRKREENRKFIIVVSDGAPVDDSTLVQNGGQYLENHLRSVIQQIAQAGDIQLLAIGIGHAVDRYYERSITVATADDLGTALLELIEQLVSTAPGNV
jgi:transglutaminase-like putative cysteine protease